MAKAGGKAPGSRKPNKGGFTKGDPRISKTHQWKPGESGNPAGMPKNRRETADRIEELLREHVDELVTALRLHALKGSPTHMVEALNRVAGKVPDKTELTGADGEDIQVRVKARAELVAKLTAMVATEPKR